MGASLDWEYRSDIYSTVWPQLSTIFDQNAVYDEASPHIRADDHIRTHGHDLGANQCFCTGHSHACRSQPACDSMTHSSAVDCFGSSDESQNPVVPTNLGHPATNGRDDDRVSRDTGQWQLGGYRRAACSSLGQSYCRTPSVVTSLAGYEVTTEDFTGWDAAFHHTFPKFSNPLR